MYGDLFGTFIYKNTELGTLADFCNEVAITVAREQSAGMTMGLNDHAIARQVKYLENASQRLSAIRDAPIPDLPATHPMTFDTVHIEPDMITVDGIPLNKDAKAVSAMWQIVAYELLKSNSAGLGGGATSFDADRCQQNLAAIEQFISAIDNAADVDFPETAAPEAVPTKKK